MRYRQILEESPKAYLPMYSGIPIMDQWDVLNFVEKCEKTLGKKDRVTWMVRWHRIWYANHVNELIGHKQRNAETDDDGNVIDKTIPQPVGEKVWRKLLQGVGGSDWGKAVDEADEVVAMFQTFKHYLGLPIAKIQSVVWDRQTPDELIAEFDTIEEEWKESIAENRGVRLHGDEEIALDFKNGWAWWDLNRASCRDEANAMGHCGNGGSHGNESILSLRKKIDDNYWSPHLTFIVDRQGILGEMKGRNNDKPAPKYHDMIVALLRSDNVNGIKGGGYLPENNFALADLPDDVQEKLKEEKPALREVWEIYKDWKEQKDAGELDENMDAAFKHKLEVFLEGLPGRSTHDEIDYEKEEIIIDSTRRSSYLAHNNSMVGDLSSLLEDLGLEDLIVKYADTEEDKNIAASIDSMVGKEWFEPLFELLLGADENFQLSGVHMRQTADKEYVQTVISIRELIFEDEDQLNSIHEGIDERYDNPPDDYDWLEAPADPVGQAIFNYVTSLSMIKNKSSGNRTTNFQGQERDLVDAILAVHGTQSEIDAGGGRRYTPTIPDPRQMQFDFDGAADQDVKKAA